MIAETIATAAPYALTFVAGLVVAWVAACFVIDGRDYRADVKKWRSSEATRYGRALEIIAEHKCMWVVHDEPCDDRERCVTCEARAALRAEGETND